MEVLRRQEAIPAAYPETPEGLLSDAAAALDAGLIWQRIEAWIAYRWTEREVIWTVAGPAEFDPDLTPATITTQEIWDGSTWIAASLDASPLGGAVLGGHGPYRLTATVGGGDVPAAVTEAFRRLSEYMAERPTKQGASNSSASIGAVSEEFQRSATWVARAMHLSGAADLLRQYRRA